jgi:hypothetical protein
MAKPARRIGGAQAFRVGTSPPYCGDGSVPFGVELFGVVGWLGAACDGAVGAGAAICDGAAGCEGAAVCDGDVTALGAGGCGVVLAGAAIWGVVAVFGVVSSGVTALFWIALFWGATSFRSCTILLSRVVSDR